MFRNFVFWLKWYAWAKRRLDLDPKYWSRDFGPWIERAPKIDERRDDHETADHDADAGAGEIGFSEGENEAGADYRTGAYSDLYPWQLANPHERVGCSVARGSGSDD